MKILLCLQYEVGMLNMAMLKAMQSHEKGLVEGTMHPFIVVKHNSNYLFYGYLTPFPFS